MGCIFNPVVDAVVKRNWGKNTIDFATYDSLKRPFMGEIFGSVLNWKYEEN